MEVSWVLLLIVFVFCSCSHAIDMKKGNSSIIDDFHLLDKLIQQEICKMLKEANTSSRFHLDEKEMSPDLCNDLESLDSKDVEKNSAMSKIDLLPFLDSNSSSAEKRGIKMETFSPSVSVGNPAPGPVPFQKNFPATSTISENPVLPSNSTVQKNPAYFGAPVPKVMVTPTSGDSTIPSDLRDPSSPEPSPILNTRELIINSNTPMRPDPTYGDEESNPPNSLESSASVSNASKFTDNPRNPFVSYQHSTKRHTGSTSCQICFPGKCDKSSTPRVDEHSSEHKSTSDSSSEHDLESDKQYSPASSAEIKTNGTTEDFSREFHIIPEKKTSTSLKSTTSTAYSKGNQTLVSDLCLECPKTTLSSTILNDFFYNLTCLKYCSTKPSTYITNLTSGPTSLIKSKTTGDFTQRSTQLFNPFTLTFRPTLFSRSNTSHDFITRSPDSSYSSKPTSNRTLLSKSHNFIPRLSSSPSSSKASSSSTPSSRFQTAYSSTSRSSTSSDKLKTTSAKPYSTEHHWLPSLTNSTTKFPQQLLSGTSTPSHQTLVTSATELTTHFCGISTIKRYQSINTTTSPKSMPKPWCNAAKLTVNAKSPRATRRRTKIYSSVGNLHSYAGFFNTDQQDNVRLFFWFFCNRKWKNTPLIVWLQGEPGQSSLQGLFQEHGPYYVEHTIDGVDIKLRQFSWAKEYNVLYLDSCVGCGFSTADHEEAHAPSYDKVAGNVYEALKQFFRVWHEMQSNDLYLAGSYGGAKYIPVIAHKIHNENAIVSFCGRRMNLKGLLIGGPYVNSATMVNYNDFLLASGIIDEITHKDMIPLQYQAQQLIRSGKYQDAIDFINIHIYCLISQAGYDVYEDTRIMRKHQYENLRHIFQSEQFKRMICMDEITFESKSDMLIEEIMPSVDNLMPKLLSHYKVLYYNGQFDLMAPYMLTSKSLLELEWESINQFYTTEMIQWCPFPNGTSCPTGFYRNYENLTHVMVRNAGHSVGATHSKSLFYLLKWFVEDKFQRYQDNGNWYE